MTKEKLVEVSEDILGFVLVYARDHGDNREGEPLGEPDYYMTRSAALAAARKINAEATPK
jgi:hypothetical protein